MSSNLKRRQILVFLLFTSLIMIFERISSNIFGNYSFEFIVFLQEKKWLYGFWNLISLIGGPDFKILILIITFTFCNHNQTFIISFTTFSTLFYSSIIKIFLQSNRPFWLYKEINAFECEFDFGFPSNHLSTTIPVFVFFWEIIYYRLNLDKEDKNSRIFATGFILLDFFFFLLGLSRLFMGVHSLEQVFLGYLIGYAFYYNLKIVIGLDVRKNHLMINFIKYSSELYYFLVFYFLIYLFYVVSLLYMTDKFDVNMIQIIAMKCKKDFFYSPFWQTFVDSGDYFGVLGAIIGILIDRLRYDFAESEELMIVIYIRENLNQNLKNSLTGYWNNTSFMTGIMRCILILLEIFLIILTLNLINLESKNVIIYYFFGKCLPSFFINFVLFSFSKMSAIYLGLSNENYKINDSDSKYFYF